MELTTMMVWVLLSVTRAVSYSPPMPTKNACETLKTQILAIQKATDYNHVPGQHTCIELPLAVPDSNARWRPMSR